MTHCRKVPPGDPTYPPKVRFAKLVKAMIDEKANLGEGKREYDMEQNTFAHRKVGLNNNDSYHDKNYLSLQFLCFLIIA